MALEFGIICTANVCRSPMAAALLRSRVERDQLELDVVSAGLMGGGRRADPAAVRAMDRRGIDLDPHRSTQVSAIDLAALDLILTMERDQAREIVVTEPDLWPRTFTFKEYVRRAQRAGERGAEEPWGGWLDRVGDGRDRVGLLGDGHRDDVLYPAPPTLRAVEATARELEGLIDEVVTRSFRPTAIKRPSADPFNT